MSTPTINVNLTPCHCPVDPGHPQHMDSQCRARPIPIPIPCPIPRSVVFEVRLGECTCGGVESTEDCATWCPARPIRVTCTIGGDGTWAGSEVTFCESRDGFPVDDAIAVCRECWALVKALVLGKACENISPDIYRVGTVELCAQRDAVFAALAAMARCERAYWEAAKAIYVAFPQADVSSDMQVVDPGDDDGETPSARWLTAYVHHLTTEIGAMP